jgi:hypothetical protein
MNSIDFLITHIISHQLIKIGYFSVYYIITILMSRCKYFFFINLKKKSIYTLEITSHTSEYVSKSLLEKKMEDDQKENE